jgi:hypothetical protein
MMEQTEEEKFPWENVKLDLELDLKTDTEYSGQVNSKGEPHGFGCQSKGANGRKKWKYIGTFENGERSGYGWIQYTNYSAAYKGEFFQGMQHGTGKFSWKIDATRKSNHRGERESDNI